MMLLKNGNFYRNALLILQKKIYFVGKIFFPVKNKYFINFTEKQQL